MRLANEKEQREIIEEAKVWYKMSLPRFQDAPYTATVAVAEYIANQQGLTLYHSRAEDGNDC